MIDFGLFELLLAGCLLSWLAVGGHVWTSACLASGLPVYYFASLIHLQFFIKSLMKDVEFFNFSSPFFVCVTGQSLIFFNFVFLFWRHSEVKNSTQDFFFHLEFHFCWFHLLCEACCMCILIVVSVMSLFFYFLTCMACFLMSFACSCS